MVRRIWLPFFIAWMLLIVPTALAANEAEDFEQFMNERDVNKGWSAESVTQWGDAAAAVTRKHSSAKDPIVRRSMSKSVPLCPLSSALFSFIL